MVGPSWYEANKPGVPSSLTMGIRSAKRIKGSKALGSAVWGVCNGMKPLDVVTVKGSRDLDMVVGSSSTCFRAATWCGSMLSKRRRKTSMLEGEQWYEVIKVIEV